MESGFIYCKPVTGKNFIGRRAESAALCNLLRAGENVVVYEPPKCGKKSLFQQSFFAMRVAGDRFSVVEVSLLNVRTVADMMLKLGEAVIRTTGNTAQEYADSVAGYLDGTHYVFDNELYDSRDKVLSLAWDVDENDMRAILSLPYRVGRDRGQRYIVLLHDFQNVMLTEDGEGVCRLMEGLFKGLDPDSRAYANYMLSGSMVNAMKEIFEVRRCFSHCVERLEMAPVASKDIVDASVRVFLSTGKVVDRDLMTGVCNLFKNNVWYINHFCSICDHMSKGYIMEQIMTDALEKLISLHEIRFKAIMNDLTTYQVCLLRAIIDGHTKFSSSDVIERYNLNSSANVKRVREALCKKEIITFAGREQPVIQDPLFEYWATKYFFEINR